MSWVDRSKVFIHDVETEARKVTWPTREELVESTWVVIVTVAIISVLVAIMDLIWSNLIKLVL